jgi:hypothetical protein
MQNAQSKKEKKGEDEGGVGAYGKLEEEKDVEY